MGRAMNKAVTIAEILKQKVHPPLHQLVRLSSMEVADVYAPLEEGLDCVTSRRFVSCLTITLSQTNNDMNMNECGYQAPMPRMEQEIKLGGE
jgi:hypothetical protein